MTTSDVAVIIPAYNAAGWIARALKSVLQQSRQASEIIVVDDGSTDNTGRIAAAFPGVRVVFQLNLERGAARNTGVRAAEAAWIALLDADDEWLPEHLECVLQKLRDDEADVTCGAYQVVDSSGQTLWVTRPWSETNFKDPLRPVVVGTSPAATCMTLFLEWRRTIRRKQTFTLNMKDLRTRVLTRTSRVCEWATGDAVDSRLNRSSQARRTSIQHSQAHRQRASLRVPRASTGWIRFGSRPFPERALCAGRCLQRLLPLLCL